MDGVGSIFAQMKKSRGLSRLDESSKDSEKVPFYKKKGWYMYSSEADNMVVDVLEDECHPMAGEVYFDSNEDRDCRFCISYESAKDCFNLSREFDDVSVDFKVKNPKSEKDIEKALKTDSKVKKEIRSFALKWFKNNVDPDLFESEDSGEEFTVVKCSDCGAVLSALDESEEGCPVCGSEDLSEKTVKVVKDGKVVKKTINTKKRRLTSAQRAALAKARKKAHTASANKKRSKSRSVRKKKGLNEEEGITCPDCGYEGSYDDFDECDGVLICPECGAELDEACGSKKGK